MSDPVILAIEQERTNAKRFKVLINKKLQHSILIACNPESFIKLIECNKHSEWSDINHRRVYFL